MEIKMKPALLIATTAALCLCGAAGAASGPRGPLPSFEVTSSTGATVKSLELTAERRWLLIYISPESSPSNRLLRLLGDWASPALLSRTVVIVAGDAAGAQGHLGRRLPEQLQGHLRWFADPDERAREALALKGTPVLIGVEDGQVQWTISGVLSRPESLESVVRTWVEKP